MSEVKLVLRDATRTRAGTIHGACSGRFVAALAADPVTLEELDVAIERFEKRDEDRSFFGWFGGSDAEPWDAGLVVIDLAAKLVVVDSTYSSPGKEGAVSYHDGRSATDVRCRYRLADDWLVTSGIDHWEHLADRRRAERATQPTLDARAIFYGRPLLEFLSAECFREFARRDEILCEVHVKWIARQREWLARHPDDPQSQLDPSTQTLEELAWKASPGQEHCASPFYDTLKDIHANWLMTPRDDLFGKTPRARFSWPITIICRGTCSIAATNGAGSINARAVWMSRRMPSVLVASARMNWSSTTSSSDICCGRAGNNSPLIRRHPLAPSATSP